MWEQTIERLDSIEHQLTTLEQRTKSLELSRNRSVDELRTVGRHLLTLDDSLASVVEEVRVDAATERAASLRRRVADNRARVSHLQTSAA